MTITAGALLMAVVVAGGLVRRHLARLRPQEMHQESMVSVVHAEPPVPQRGLSRRRKGFDDAIAVLGTAAAQNRRLAVYYDRVVKRTKPQSFDAGSGASPISPAPSTSSVDVHEADAVKADVAKTASEADSGSAVKPAGPTASREQSQDPAGQPGNAASGPRAADTLVIGDISFDVNPAISHWVNYYTATRVGRSTMQQGLNRCAEYLDASRAEFKERGLPEDLVWLAQVESVWKQGAYSRVAAGGIWQFMPSTAVDYGLAVGSHDDERFDPAKETRAAATYLRDLYTLFGNWELAMAAYNCGEPRLMDGIVRCGEPDFWELYDRGLLPKETRDYVPKILAAIKVASDPDAYGFSVAPGSSVN
jgi:hypothetical protein